MLEVSAQQRKLIMFLCRESGAVTVQTLAKKNHISQQTASSQLKKLKESGFVESTQYGRQSYYEIAEPLLRMVLSVKDNRGAPIKLAIDLIRHFYTVTELKQIKNNEKINLLGIKCLTEDIINSAIESDNPNPHVVAAIKDFEKAFEKHNFLETKKIINGLNNDIKDEFNVKFVGFLVKVFKGDFVKLTHYLLSALPNGHSFQQAILSTLLLMHHINKKTISSRKFYEMLKPFDDLQKMSLSCLIFRDDTFYLVKTIKFNKKNYDPLIKELIDNGTLYLDSFDEMKQQLTNILQFIESTSSYDYLPLLMSSVWRFNKKLTKEHIKVVLEMFINANGFRVEHFYLLMTLSAIGFHQNLFNTIKLLIENNENYKDLYSYEKIISKYFDTRDLKDLLELPKEVRSLIIKGNEDE
jgi:DNA-binding transcriptional ArsR family regulator